MTDVEALQKNLHSYAAIGRKDAVSPVFQVILGIVDEVFQVELRDTERARDILLATKRLSARDALHLAMSNILMIRIYLRHNSD